MGVVLTNNTAKMLGEAGDTVPAHLCVYAGGGGGEDEDDHGDDRECPCCPSPNNCGCRCVSPDACACPACRDPYHTGGPEDATNSTGTAAGTVDRPHRLLLAGGAPDAVEAAPAPGRGVSPRDSTCALCGCRWTGGGGGSSPVPAVIYRCTGGLSAAPLEGFAATSGVFTVAGAAPSASAGKDVFTWQTGDFFYSRGRYTVAGLGVGLAGAPADAPPRAQAGHTNVLSVTTRVPADGGGTVAFSGHTNAASARVKNRLTGQYEPLQDSYPASEWLARYTDENNRAAEVRHTAALAGPCLFAVAYEQPGALPGSVSTNLAFEAVGARAEAVNAAADADGHVYNTSGMPLGGTARFRVEAPGGAVPGADITWTIKEGAGRVAFAGGSTGPEIAVTATSTGAFRLEVDIKGLVITPPHVRPFFVGEVLQPKTVPVAVWVARHSAGYTPATPSRIAGMIADANKILWQVAITLAWDGTISYTNHNDWYALNLPPDNIVTNGSTVWQLLNCTNDTGGVELYFVNNMVTLGEVTPTHGFNVRGLGLVLGRLATGHTLAHEVMHECGLADIYNSEGGLSVSGAVGPGRLSDADWGGGYYPPGLQQADFNSERLLMYGRGDPETTVAINIPRGAVYGIGLGSPAQTNLMLGPVSVGRNSMEPGEPVH
jgi:hypothetical protein